MNVMQQLLTEHIDIWTAAETEKKSGRGRAAGNAGSVYGIRKLRELILELAVHGKLVPQDANDEPASELLKRIQTEKKNLIAEGKIKIGKPQSLITEEEEPFMRPYGWEWVRLGEIAEIIRGVTYGKSDASDSLLPDYVPLLRGNNINRFLNFDHPVFVPKRLLNEDQYVRAGDIVIAMSSGSADLVGKAAQATEDFNGGFGAFCGVVRSVSDQVLSFFGFFFQTPLYKIRAAGHGKGIGINNLQKTVLQTLEIPLPPLAEQHRIIAKVDELMALCDQLETRHSDAVDAHEQLVRQLLGTLTQSQYAADFSANWQRIAAHFDTLFTTESSIDALKQTLLQLAVMGKLVPQDPSDEPASDLLKRIQAEKAKLAAEGRIKKDKPVAAIPEDEKPFDLPERWNWVRLGNIVEVTSSKRIHVKDYVSEGVPFFRSKEIGELQRGLSISTDIFIAREKYEGLKDLAGFPQVNDLMLTSVGSIGNTWLSDGREFYYKDGNITKLGATNLLSMRFVQDYIGTPLFDNQVTDTVSGTAYNALTITKLNALAFPLPPLSEQHRIVAKVDELMALCDQLKSRISDASQLQQTLADVLVEQAVA